MKNKTLRFFSSLLIVASLIFSTSCAFDGERFTFANPGLPIEIGLQYELEEDLSILLAPTTAGEYEVTLVGSGDLAEWLEKTDDGIEITSPHSGLIYLISKGGNGKPRITIAAGNGKLKPIEPAK